MKKGKLLILLAAILSLSLLFVACDQPAEGAGSENGSDQNATETESAKTEGETIADVAEQETEKHEIHNYFDLVSEQDDVLLSNVSRIDGELMHCDPVHNLAVIKTVDLDAQNMVTETWNVYDLATDKIIFTDSVVYAYMAEDPDKTDLTVSVNYPVIRAMRTTCTEDEDGVREYDYSVSYYLAREGNEGSLHTTDSTDFYVNGFQNGLVCVEMGDKMFWIDKNLEIVRTVDAIIANGYDVEGIRSEYKGYLYSWDSDELLIFNRSGIVSATYLAGKDSTINVFVLNNGNALVQEITTVGVYDSCDFVLQGNRYTVKSSIVNFITGATEEVELNFVVSSMITQYYQGRNESTKLVLADGAENYCYVYNFVNGYIAKGASICVVDNTLNKLFSLENETYGIDFGSGITPIRDDLYRATVKTEATNYKTIFNLKGEIVSHVFGDPYYTEKYIVSDTTVYDYYMNPVYDIQGNGYTLEEAYDDVIYLSFDNFKTGVTEYYVIRSDSKTPEMFADGVDYIIASDFGNEYYILYDVERDVYVVYNVEGEELIVSHEPFDYPSELDGITLFKTTFNGEAVVYVVK